MRKLLLLSVMVALPAAFTPISAAPQQYSCSSTTGVAVTDVATVGCSFALECSSDACVYWPRLDVNGTGVVAGEMTVEIVGPSEEDDVIFRNGMGEEINGSGCGATLFSCSFGMTGDDDVTLLVTQNVFVVRCSGGGLAAVETVSCSLFSIE